MSDVHVTEKATSLNDSAAAQPSRELLRELLRMPAVLQATGLSVATIYREIAAGRFPRPIKITARCSAWAPNSIAEWQRRRLAESGQEDGRG